MGVVWEIFAESGITTGSLSDGASYAISRAGGGQPAKLVPVGRRINL